MTFSNDLLQLAETVLAESRARGLRLAVAESCTGGLIAGCLTAIAGSSDVVERGFVTYTNAAKTDMLGVTPALLDAHGAVSREAARAMAEGALTHSPADVALAVTGIAGPTGGSADKPVGLVHLAAAGRQFDTMDQRHVFPGDRTAVRQATVAVALTLVLDVLRRPSAQNSVK